LIGSGIYGIVASGKNKITNQPVAIKKISKLFNNFGDTRRVLR
jgi:serine/threonine protein kinase